MFRSICRWLFKLHGWKVGPVLPKEVTQCVLIAAPHTSNWDLIYAMAAYDQMGLKVRFTIKQEWVRFPFKTLFERLGAIPIDRTPKHAGTTRNTMVETMSQLFRQEPTLVVMITPEGTRSAVKRWKMGFYHLAKNAQVPIALGYLDYAKKEAGIAGVLHTSDDMEKDLRQLYDFYNSVTPKYPEKFTRL